jgi:glycosyltransferase involved in cell wall biosynthesis
MHENYPDEMRNKYWIPKPLRAPLSWLVKWGQIALILMVRNVVLVVPSQQASLPRRYVRRVVIFNYASRRLLAETRDDYEHRSDAVIFTGGQYESNGSLLLLEIAEHVRQVCPGVRFLVADRFSGNQRERYLEQLQRRRLQETVELLPQVPPHDIMTLLNRATIAISPNLRIRKQEMAIPTKLFEYMAAGLPIVTSDLPHQEALIAKTRAGLLARPEDVQSFVDAIRSLVEDRALARELGRNGQRALQGAYSWEGQMPKLLAFYRMIIS